MISATPPEHRRQRLLHMCEAELGASTWAHTVAFEQSASHDGLQNGATPSGGMAVMLVVRGPDNATLKRRSKRLEQGVMHLGAGPASCARRSVLAVSSRGPVATPASPRAWVPR